MYVVATTGKPRTGGFLYPVYVLEICKYLPVVSFCITIVDTRSMLKTFNDENLCKHDVNHDEILQVFESDLSFASELTPSVMRASSTSKNLRGD